LFLSLCLEASAVRDICQLCPKLALRPEGTVETKGLTTAFRIEDFERNMARELSVTYTGALPDLFREGQGVVVSGQLTSPTTFQAREVLAKHDENYQPKINYRDDTPNP